MFQSKSRRWQTLWVYYQVQSFTWYLRLDESKGEQEVCWLLKCACWIGCGKVVATGEWDWVFVGNLPYWHGTGMGSLHVIQGHPGRHQCPSKDRKATDNGRYRQQPYWGDSTGKARQSRINSVGLASLNNTASFGLSKWSLVVWYQGVRWFRSGKVLAWCVKVR